MLRIAVGWGECKPERVQMALNRSDFLIVATCKGQSIGMARVIHDGLQALIMDVMVLPEYQGAGIGKTLMQHVMEYLNALAADGCIYVNLMSALGREGFYEQFGFICRPNEARGPGMTQLLGK